MARRRERQRPTREQTSEQILDGAAQAFAERGFHGASLDNIAGRVGLTKGAFQSSFRSKEELFIALYDRMIVRIRERLATALHSINDDDISLVDAVRGFARNYPLDRNWYLLNAEFTLYAIRQPAIAPMLAERKRRLLGDIAATIEDFLCRRGMRLAAAPERVGRLLMAIYDGNLAQSLVDPQAIAPGELLLDLGEPLLRSLIRPDERQTGDGRPGREPGA